MEKIPSFKVDHTRLLPGIYVSRIDTLGAEYASTYDIRLKRPNLEPVISASAMHTIEHVIATFLRNDEAWKNEIIYWGPMGCLTGCYLIMKGKREPKEILPLIISAFKYLADFEGEIPGADPASCGNYSFQNLEQARLEAKRYLSVLEAEPAFVYPE